MQPRRNQPRKSDSDRFHVATKRPSLRVHAIKGGFLPVLLYWGRGKAEWYRYHRPLPTQEEAERIGTIELRKLRRLPHHYFAWESDPWKKFDGEVPKREETTLEILKELGRTGPLAGVASIMREMEEERIKREGDPSPSSPSAPAGSAPPHGPAEAPAEQDPRSP